MKVDVAPSGDDKGSGTNAGLVEDHQSVYLECGAGLVTVLDAESEESECNLTFLSTEV